MLNTHFNLVSTLRMSGNVSLRENGKVVVMQLQILIRHVLEGTEENGVTAVRLGKQWAEI